jgi:hypothetical protein
MSYGGLGAVKRAELAADVVKSRLKERGISCRDLAVNFIGIQSLHGNASASVTTDPYEVRLRIAGITDNDMDAFYNRCRSRNVVNKRSIWWGGGF